MFHGDLPLSFLIDMRFIAKNYILNATFEKWHLKPTSAESKAQLNDIWAKIQSVKSSFTDLEKSIYYDEETLDWLELSFVEQQLPITNNENQPKELFDFFKEVHDKFLTFAEYYHIAERSFQDNHLPKINDDIIKQGRINLAVKVGKCFKKYFKLRLTTTDPMKNQQNKKYKNREKLKTSEPEVGAFTSCVQLMLKKAEGSLLENNIQKNVIIPAFKILEKNH